MMDRRAYRFGGVEFLLEFPEGLCYTDERRLAPFRVEKVEDPHVFSFRRVEKLTPPAGECIVVKPSFRVYEEGGAAVRYIGSVSAGWEYAYLRARHEGKRHDVELLADQFPGTVSTNAVLDAMAAEHWIARNRGLILHCSCVDIGGRAVVFTAPSETGKSTQADLWAALRGARIINGDRALIRMDGEAILAEGIPYSGSSSYCEKASLPLAAVVYLGQAPATTIEPLRGYRAFSKIWEGVSVNTWDRRDLEEVSALVQTLAARVPVYYLNCTPDESAVTALEQALEGGRP